MATRKGWWASEMNTWSPDKMRQILEQYGQEGLTENTYKWLSSRVKPQGKSASFVKVADPNTKIFPVNWTEHMPLHGVKYLDPNKKTASGYDYIAGNADWKTAAAKRMRENPADTDYIKSIQQRLVDSGAYDDQLYDLDDAGLKRIQQRLKVLGKYSGPVDGKISDGLINAYRAVQVDGKYGTRTETALAKPDRQLVTPTRTDNTHTYGSYLSGNPGSTITGGQYPEVMSGKGMQLPDDYYTTHPEKDRNNWHKEIVQDTGKGDTFYVYTDASGKRHVKSKQQLDKFLSQGSSVLKEGGAINYLQYLC